MRILYIEPYEAGAHARFTRALTRRVPADWTLLTLPGRHWKWRARGSAAYFALARADAFRPPPDLLFASAYLPLTDLVALRPELAAVPRVLYFHENQLAYPVRDDRTGERDFHFGFSQLVAALAATRCVFNSAYNRDSLLTEGAALLRRMPDAVPPGWIEAIRARSEVLPVPLELPGLFDGIAEPIEDDTHPSERALGPIILWNHRWEHDKAPEAFFSALYALADRGVPFRVAICGERFGKAPPVFAEARARLADRIVHWGFLPSRAEYEALLARCHIAVSTARHEFFGISMLEATWFGARPLVPDRLSYVELFPDDCRYAEDTLIDTLATLCHRWHAGDALRADRRALVRPFGPPLIARYTSRLSALARGPRPG